MKFTAALRGPTTTADASASGRNDALRFEDALHGDPLSAPTGSLDRAEGAYLALVSGIVVLGWTSLLLAEFGRFGPVVPIIAAIVTSVALLLWFSRSLPQLVPLVDFLPIVLVVVAAGALYFPADEWVLGALDPGVYVNTGVIIVRTGGIVVQTPLVAALPPAVRANLVTPVIPGPPSRFPGVSMRSFRIVPSLSADFETDYAHAVPHGFHYYPSILAVGYALGGLDAELAVTPVLATLALVGFYLFVRRLFGRATATVAAVLLLVSPAEVWFARYPAAEILVQFLTFAGLLALVALVDRPSAPLAIVAGLSLGATHLAKIETVITVPLIVGFAGYQLLSSGTGRSWVWFSAAYGLMVLHAFLHAVFVASIYSYSQIGGYLPLLHRPIIQMSLAGLIAVCLSLVVSDGFRARARGALRVPYPGRILRSGLPFVVAGLSIYGYYLRPLGSVASPLTAVDFVRNNELQSFVRLGWFVTPLGLLLGVLGWMYLVHRQLTPRTALAFAMIGADSFLFLADAQITPVYFWAARRWVPLVIPGFCLAAAYFLGRLWPGVRNLRKNAEQCRAPALATIGLGLVLLVGMIGGDRPLLGYVEYRGAVAQLTALARVFPPDAIVVFPNGDSGQRFSLPLEYIFNRHSFVVDSSIDAAAGAAVRSWLSEGRAVYWVATPGPGDPSAIGLRGTIVAERRVSLPEKIATRDTRPGANGLFQQSLTIWRLESPTDHSQTR